ncbi:hypothetical protein JHK87_038129 [Glycine soja]|nr:hypothetical protein JHK87_038129 [Glycine soja]
MPLDHVQPLCLVNCHHQPTKVSLFHMLQIMTPQLFSFTLQLKPPHYRWLLLVKVTILSLSFVCFLKQA